ncbi:glucose-6-phosphate dehydrogenase [Rothia mucilaginosa]|uniref:glucose-6-phosphate dehydrogenase n=1 Tax=Rothia mucilaginosa TaxID=43675 RepID=UPI0026ED990B|nr:glucose-6-phosphate dehydrogenase [Rothia mucilaginosa]
MVIFGVTGDLAFKKLLPAIYDLASRGLLPAGFTLVGYGRRDWDNADFCDYFRSAVEAGARTDFNHDVWEHLSQGIEFVQGSFDDEGFDKLSARLAELDKARGTGSNWAYYLSVPPEFFSDICHQLERVGMANSMEDSWRRVIIEKPFGHDQESARELNEIVNAVFPESAVFRIDHYLGKETVQNILAMRFSNQMFEPLWNSHYVDHVQITMAEDIGIGSRAGYYDGVGAARDIIQNHLLQLLALTAMEEPLSLDAKHLRAEKAKVLEAVQIDDLPNSFALGQYSAGYQGGEHVNGFFDEKDIPADSRTETFAALKVSIANRRWEGTPFYLRAGKRLGRRVTEIAVIFKKSSDRLFGESENPQVGQNAIVIRVQPDEGMTIRFAAKVPGTQMEIRDVNMDFGYGHSFTEESPEAYERLILDVLLGEPPLFPRHEEVELSWKILDPFEEYWEENRIKPEPYESGSWGPRSAHEMLERDNRAWRRP